MPTRLLRDWTDSLRFDGITAEAERLFLRLIMKADDYGRFHADPRLIKAACFPLLDNLRTPDLVRWLDELSTRQLILRYEAGGRCLLAIVNYGQRLKQSKAKFPPPPDKPEDFLPLSEHFREVPGSSGNIPLEGKGRDTEEEGEAGTPPPAADKTPPPPLSPKELKPIDRIKAELALMWPKAPKHWTGKDLHELHSALEVLAELSQDDWLACRCWVICPDRVRDRALWPRDRIEFISNAGQAVEAIRKWWPLAGRKWWDGKQSRPAEPKPAGPAAEPAEDPASALKLWEEIHHKKDVA
jgi:hypothetical protein